MEERVLHQMDTYTKAIRSVRSKIAAFLLLRRMVTFVTVWGFLWGLVVLVLRGAVGVPLLPLVWGSAGLLVPIGLAVGLTLRCMPSRTAVRALLDRMSGCGGLLMAAEDRDIGRWERQIPSLSTPSLRWRNVRCWGLFAAATVFVLVSFLVPRRFAAIGSSHALDVGKEVEKLAAQIETLEEEEIIEPSRAESLEEKLTQLRLEASGEDPVKTWESLDHLEEIVAQTAREAAEDALGKTERLTQAETLAEGLAEGAAGMDPQLMAEAMRELADMVERAAEETDLFEGKLSSELMNFCKAGSLSPEQLGEISAALRLYKGDIARCLGRLCRAGLIDIETVRVCEELGEFDSTGLAAFLAENKDIGSVCELVGLWCEGLPGRGGVTRGRGDAPMTWSDGTSEEGATFKEQSLPPAAVAALKENLLVGVSIAAPSVADGVEASKVEALADAVAGGGAAHTQTILPRHRGAVKRYFERR